ncbi:peptidase domain-containing ABC transporter [Pelomicrobium sp.]|jgi:ATP-binding cassette subfamily B protein RaxB|uniref:peptidase domain-containing ABC transporter n=1 Tax=Pelomicrobium sp. TaxID=2815319 RepID=UPI002FDCD018
MRLHHALAFGLGHKLPLILQNEAAECGVACIAMIAGYHGLKIDLYSLRRTFTVSMMGTTLNQLVQIANALSLATRAVKLDLDDLDKLRRPCVLHWNFNHFVVLKKVRVRSIVIHDPAVGIRELSMEEVSRSFTGVALEAWPNESFKPATVKQRISFSQLLGKVSGLVPSLVQVLMLAFVLEVFVIIGPFYLQWVIDDVIVASDRDLLVTIALAFGLLVIFQQAISLLRGWVMLYLSTTLNLQWRSNLFTHLVRLPLRFFENRHLGDIVSRFGSIDVIQRSVTSQFIETVLDGVMSVIVLMMMFVYDPMLASIALAVIFAYTLIRWLWWRPFRLATEEQIVHAAKQQSHFLETVRGIKPIKLFQRIDERRNSWLTLLVEEINAGLRTQKMQLFYRHINSLMFGIERVTIIGLGAVMVMNNRFTVGALMAFLAYKDQFAQRSSTLIDHLFELRMLRLHGERLADIALARPEYDGSTTTCVPAPHWSQLPAAPGVPCIELTNICFRYSELSPWVLQDVNLRIAQGESVAIVGPSGSGKTTLMHVLLGLRTPNSGEIRFFGTDIRQFGQQRVLSLIGTVTQDDLLFAGSLADNISFFDPEADQTRIERCARMADIHTDIEAMPMGYNTLVGDMGTVLSGGQKQRVLLARALYREPKILVLDEATSSLDIESEERVNAAIRALDLTRIIITHRPQTIATVDRVVVLRHGRIVADLPPDDFTSIRKAMKGELNEATA